MIYSNQILILQFRSISEKKLKTIVLLGGGLIGVTVQIINCIYVMQIFGTKAKPGRIESPSGRPVTISIEDSNDVH